MHNAFCLTIGPLSLFGDVDDNDKDNCDNNDDGNNGDDDDDQQQALHAQHLLSHDACTTTSLTGGRCLHNHTIAIAKEDLGGLSFRLDGLSSLAL